MICEHGNPLEDDGCTACDREVMRDNLLGPEYSALLRAESNAGTITVAVRFRARSPDEAQCAAEQIAAALPRAKIVKCERAKRRMRL